MLAAASAEGLTGVGILAQAIGTAAVRQPASPVRATFTGAALGVVP